MFVVYVKFMYSIIQLIGKQTCYIIEICGSVPVISVMLWCETPGEHPADGLLSAINVVLEVLGLRQLLLQLMLFLQQGELKGSVR